MRTFISALMNDYRRTPDMPVSREKEGGGEKSYFGALKRSLACQDILILRRISATFKWKIRRE